MVIDMTDIVDRLKNYRYPLPSGKAVQPEVCVVAAAEIELLRAALKDAEYYINIDFVGTWLAKHKLDEVLK